MKLRAKGQKVTVPSPPAALKIGGDDTPVNSRKPFYGGDPSTTLMASPPANNVGSYTPPPKNRPWVAIPTSVKPTPYRNVIVR